MANSSPLRRISLDTWAVLLALAAALLVRFGDREIRSLVTVIARKRKTHGQLRHPNICPGSKDRNCTASQRRRPHTGNSAAGRSGLCG